MNPDVAAELKDLSATLESIEAVTDLPALRAEIADLSEQAGRPDLWNDPDAAQKVNSRLSHAQGDLRRVDELRRRLDDLPVLYELAEEEGDEGSLADADAERAKLHQDIESLEVRTLLSGEYDAREALVTIRSEAGGVDAAEVALRVREAAVDLLRGLGVVPQVRAAGLLGEVGDLGAQRREVGDGLDALQGGGEVLQLGCDVGVHNAPGYAPGRSG